MLTVSKCNTMVAEKYFLVAIILCMLLRIPSSTRQNQSESYFITKLKERALTFPPKSLLQITVGISSESDIKNNAAGIVLALQHNGKIASDIRFLVSPQEESKREFSIYEYIKKTINRLGFNGSECLKKMVCQIGVTPLTGGVLEDIINFILTPSKHRRRSSLNGNSPKDSEEIGMLLKSEKIGRGRNNCTLMYPECLITPLDIISSVLEY